MPVLRMLGSFGLGAALMYLFDPRLGRRRRARLQGQLAHAIHANQRLAGKARRDLEHRVAGLVDRVRLPARTSSDRVIAERVRSAIGHVVAHPSAIEVDVHDRHVIVTGPATDKESAKLLAVLRDVPGVSSVEDHLHREHPVGGTATRAGALPSHEATSMLMPGPRLLVGGAGAALFAGATAVRGTRGALAGLGGAALLVRAITNRPLAQVVGLAPTIVEVTKTTTIHAPLDRVFALWSRVQEFPRFMEHVQSVVPAGNDPQRSKWTVDGPLGTRLTFELRITSVVETGTSRSLSWTTVPGSAIAHSGTIHFDTVEGGTRVQIQLRYRPIGGVLGDLAARVLRADPRSRLADDLVRAKSLLERGHTRAHHHRVDIDDVLLS
jgi:uncharacterized membrane protein